MNFSDAQNKVKKFILGENISVADHLRFHKEFAAIQSPRPEYFRTIKIAFLSNFTLLGLPEVFMTRALFHNLSVEAYLAPYNQYAQEILNPESSFNGFQPTLVYFISDLNSGEEAKAAELLKRLLATSRARIVCDGSLAKQLLDNDRVHAFDLSGFLNQIGRERYWNTKYKELGDFRLAPEAFPILADAIMAHAVAVAGATKKCLVLDLDNTLWSGIVGEDGYEGVQPNQKLQEHILNLYNQGVVLAINSKNNPEDALAILDHDPRMILHREHFAARRINWQDKASNIKEIADELNLGTDSLVFVDDDYFQLNSVAAIFPEVAVLPPEKLEQFTGFASHRLTDEDRNRGKMYAAEARRRDFQSNLMSVQDFLNQLELRATIVPVKDASLNRAAQLTQKTNQFNLTARRYNEEDLQRLLAQGWKIWTIQAADRFGDYGIIGLQMVDPNR